GNAYTSGENGFVVSLTSTQSQQLRKAGLKFEILKKNVDLSSTYVIYSSKPFIQPLQKSVGISDLFDVGNGIQVAEMDVSKASSLEAEFKHIVPVLENQVPFFYKTKSYTNALSKNLDYPTDTLAELVDLDSLYAYVLRLQNFQTRLAGTDSIDAARDWIEQKFLDWGYTDVTTPSFFLDGAWHYNVMAVKPGYAEPDKVIVIGGHYDSITYGQPTPAWEFAPGADDNASGTVTTMEIARVLKDVPLRKTVIFIAFTYEEGGLNGSRFAAEEFVNAGTDLELMYNFDMVAYNPDATWAIWVTYDNDAPGYSYVTYDAFLRLTSIEPLFSGIGGGSDHYAFYERGFNIVNHIEEDFNYPGWHTDIDLIGAFNLPYYHDVVKAGVASLAIVSNSASPAHLESVLDNGDGQSIEISWTNCSSSYEYIIHLGTNPDYLPLSYNVPSGECSYMVEGLTEGLLYYCAVEARAADAYPAIDLPSDTCTPLVTPRTPYLFRADPDLNSISLNWQSNTELDMSHYRIYRDEGTGYNLYQDNITESSYHDVGVVGQAIYKYKITAVDNDMNESTQTVEVEAIPATFDSGILLADEFAVGGPLPPQALQVEYFDYVFDGTSYDLTEIDGLVNLNRSLAGKYSSLFWFDDDYNNKLIENSEDSIIWYDNYDVNIFLSGYRLVGFWTGANVPADHILNQSFGVSYAEENGNSDFIGAKGQNGWPSVQTSPFSFMGDKLPYIYALYPTIEAEVIYTFDSFTDDPNFENQPCGLLVDSPNGKRIILGFPLYYLTELGAKSIINHAKILFGEADGGNPGDFDGVEGVDIGDVVYMVEYMFNSGPEPLSFNNSDVDGNCSLDIAD
ncbi:M20/M25/M40 family metallo-hydrolase, partial [Candidatus Zixiibacteriota bacterium]